MRACDPVKSGIRRRRPYGLVRRNYPVWLGIVSVSAVLLLGCDGGRPAEHGQGVASDRAAPLDTAPVGVIPDSTSIRVEVLNAAGVSGMAREATGRLRELGFDVVYYGNAESFGRDSSLVIDRVGSWELAQAVAGAMGISRVETRKDSTLLLDVTVLLGGDWSLPIRPN